MEEIAVSEEAKSEQVPSGKQEDEPGSPPDDSLDTDTEVFRFKLKDGKEGRIFKSTLIRNKTNPDCVMLCRLCGIDVGSDDKNILKKLMDNFDFAYYDKKEDIFTIFEDHIDLTQFAVFKHWIRNKNLNLIGIERGEYGSLTDLQKACAIYGMDELSAGLHAVAMADLEPNLQSEAKSLYQWAVDKVKEMSD